MDTMGIYIIFNRISKNIYVGSSIGIEKRFGKHKNSLKLNNHQNQYLQNAYNKHGLGAFKFSILEIGKNNCD